MSNIFDGCAKRSISASMKIPDVDSDVSANVITIQQKTRLKGDRMPDLHRAGDIASAEAWESDDDIHPSTTSHPKKKLKDDLCGGSRLACKEVNSQFNPKMSDSTIL